MTTNQSPVLVEPGTWYHFETAIKIMHTFNGIVFNDLN